MGSHIKHGNTMLLGYSTPCFTGLG